MNKLENLVFISNFYFIVYVFMKDKYNETNEMGKCKFCIAHTAANGNANIAKQTFSIGI